MKKYLIDFHYGVQCKNKLQEELCHYAKSLHRMWINEDEFKFTVSIINHTINEFNVKYNRCKPETISVYDNRNGDMNISFGENGFCRLQFLSFCVKGG